MKCEACGLGGLTVLYGVKISRDGALRTAEDDIVIDSWGVFN